MLLPKGLAFFGSLMIAIGAASGRKHAPTVAQEIARAGPKEHDEQELNTTPARPQLVVVSESTGSVPKALTEILKPVPGKRVEIADAYKGYATRCREMGVKPASTVQFAA
jgi:hypothetical protein